MRLVSTASLGAVTDRGGGRTGSLDDDARRIGEAAVRRRAARPGGARRRRPRCAITEHADRRAHVGRSGGDAAAAQSARSRSRWCSGAGRRPTGACSSSRAARTASTRRRSRRCCARLGKADAAFVREATGYAIGGIPPLAHARRSPRSSTAISCASNVVYAAGGTPNAMFPIRPDDLVRVAGGISRRRRAVTSISCEEEPWNSDPCFALVAALAAATLLLGACASVVGGAAGPPRPAPDYRVGDRWVYHVVDGYPPRRSSGTRRTRSPPIGPDGHHGDGSPPRGPTVNVERFEKWPAPGVVLLGAVYEDETHRFDPAAHALPVSADDGRRGGTRGSATSTSRRAVRSRIVRHVTVGGYAEGHHAGGHVRRDRACA